MSSRDHLLQRIGPKRWPPEFFPCCCNGSKYSVSMWDNDSTFANVWTAVDDATVNLYSFGLLLSGTDVFAALNKAAGAGTSGPIVRKLDSSGATTLDYNSQSGIPGSGVNRRDMGKDSSGNLWVPIAYNVTYGAFQVRKFDTSGSAVAGALMDTTTEICQACACDSSDNVYAASTAVSGFTGTHYLYKFNSTGTKQWKTTIATGSSAVAHRCWVDTGGDIWVHNGGTLARVNSSGTVQASGVRSFVCGSDGGTGAVTADGTNVDIWDGSLASVASVAETNVNGGIECDSSGNVYLVYVGGGHTKPSIKVWDNTLTSLYTKSQFGTTYVSGAGKPFAVVANADYVWIAGYVQNA